MTFEPTFVWINKGIWGKINVRSKMLSLVYIKMHIVTQNNLYYIYVRVCVVIKIRDTCHMHKDVEH